LRFFRAQFRRERAKLRVGARQFFPTQLEIGLDFVQSLQHRAFLDLQLRQIFFSRFRFFS
jgi:hypothetical protein